MAKLSNRWCSLRLQALAEAVKSTADVVWPVAHGAWGESGQLQAVLEKAEVAFIGTPIAAAETATHKLRHVQTPAPDLVMC